MTARLHCRACSTVHEFDGPVGRSARCSKCGVDLRCCLQCRFHDLSSYNECAEPSAERVLEKDRANFCDYFSPAVGPKAPAAAADGPGGLSDLEKLFRKS